MRRLAAVLSAAWSMACLAQAPGEYLTEGGWGSLLIGASRAGAQPFRLNALGPNFHSCRLQGEIRDGRATLEGDEPGRPCEVAFTATPKGIEVAAASGGCRHACGVRAQFEGLYQTPPAGCAATETKAARAAFKRRYDARRYDEARARLEPVLACSRFLWWVDEGWVRNDLAITRYRLGDRAGCLSVLEPLAAEAAKPDAQLQRETPPGEWDVWRRVVAATRANLRLCRPPAAF